MDFRGPKLLISANDLRVFGSPGVWALIYGSRIICSKAEWNWCLTRLLSARTEAMSMAELRACLLMLRNPSCRVCKVKSPFRTVR